MKKNVMKPALLVLIAITAMLFASAIVSATEVALVVEFPNGTIYTECIDTRDETSGYNLIQQSGFTATWGDTGSSHNLCMINDQGSAVNQDGSGTCQTDEWAMYLSTEESWQALPVDYDSGNTCWNRDFGSNTGYYCGVNSDVLGLTYGTGAAPTSVYSFGDICHFGIVDFDVKIDGDSDKNLWHGDDISEDARPGSKVDLKIKLENFYTKDEDTEIRDIQVKATLRNIDDGSDIDEESEEVDIHADKTKTVDIEFYIPLLVDEDEYELEIEVEGTGDEGVGDGVDFEFTWVLTLQVDKKNHELMIRYANLDSPLVSCSEKVGISTKVINIGANEEDDVTIEISSSQLDYYYVMHNINLEEDPFDSDNSWATTQFIDLPENLEPGMYDISVKAYYDGTRLSDEEIVTLQKEDCIGRYFPDVAGEAMPAVGEHVEVIYASELAAIMGAAVQAPLISSPAQVVQPEQETGNMVQIIIFIAVMVAILVVFILLVAYVLRMIR